LYPKRSLIFLFVDLFHENLNSCSSLTFVNLTWSPKFKSKNCLILVNE
jgi:hypothetical protein